MPRRIGDRLTEDRAAGLMRGEQRSSNVNDTAPAFLEFVAY
jgi:hypothetical protein